MFNFLKKAFFEKKSVVNNNTREDEEFKNILINRKAENPIFQAMDIIYEKKNFEINDLINKFELSIDSDFVLKDEYFEVMITHKKFYLAVGTEGGTPHMHLPSIDDIFDIDGWTVDDILEKVKSEITSFFF